MKNLGRLIALSLVAVLIVLSAVRCVNYTASNSIFADGNPLPWPIPPQPPAVNNNTVLSADGNPLPWPIPPQPPAVNNNAVLTADGNPLPWPIPPQPPAGSLVA
jgi:hypothetical protein